MNRSTIEQLIKYEATHKTIEHWQKAVKFLYDMVKDYENIIGWSACCKDRAIFLDRMYQADYKIDEMQKELESVKHQRDKALMYLEEEKEARLKQWQEKRDIHRQACERDEELTNKIRLLEKQVAELQRNKT